MRRLSLEQTIEIAKRLNIGAFEILFDVELGLAIDDGNNGEFEQQKSREFALWTKDTRNYEKLYELTKDTVARFFGYDSQPWARMEDILLTIKWAMYIDNLPFDSLTPDKVINLMCKYDLGTYSVVDASQL